MPLLDDYQLFVGKIKKMTGIDLSLYKEVQMKRRLKSLYEKFGYCSFLEFYRAMERDESLLYAFLDRMTINVSEFFRNPGRWQVLEKKFFPEFCSAPAIQKSGALPVPPGKNLTRLPLF